MFLIFHLIFIIHLKKKIPLILIFFSQLTKALHYSIAFDPIHVYFRNSTLMTQGTRTTGYIQVSQKRHRALLAQNGENG